jgi:VanZ family protein
MLIFLRYWGPVCAYAIVIFVLSSQSHPEDNLPAFLFDFSDKVVHGIEYAVLGVLCYQHAIPMAILLASLYGASDEIHQSFVPFRDSSWLDWVADTIGAAIGVLAMHRAVNFRPANSIPEAWRQPD